MKITFDIKGNLIGKDCQYPEGTEFLSGNCLDVTVLVVSCNKGCDNDTYLKKAAKAYAATKSQYEIHGVKMDFREGLAKVQDKEPYTFVVYNDSASVGWCAKNIPSPSLMSLGFSQCHHKLDFFFTDYWHIMTMTTTEFESAISQYLTLS